MNKEITVEKKLSCNDVGATGSHQAGICVPKTSELLAFFPKLDVQSNNPRAQICFTDDCGVIWKFHFIYYNNKLRGGTRNEYRLTGMTRFFDQNAISEGDILIFKKTNDEYTISLRRNKDCASEDNDNGTITLVLNNNWKIISY